MDNEMKKLMKDLTSEIKKGRISLEKIEKALCKNEKKPYEGYLTPSTLDKEENNVPMGFDINGGIDYDATE